MKYGIINVSVSTHYLEPESTSAVTTQGLLGEKVEILDTQLTHIQICQKDGYHSWIAKDQLVPETPSIGKELLVRSHFMPVLASPALDSLQIRDAVIGCRLQVDTIQDGWCKIILPDGIVGWAQQKNFAAIQPVSIESILSLAKEFLGYPYFWGGTTPKGFDCSGLVQTVFGLHGVKLLRDSWQQQQHHQVSTDYHDAQPGDLLFFSGKPDTVTHVAISLGQQRYIHASGWVRLDSFNENDDVFEKQRAQSFISVNRYPDVR